ncbi:MAG TPA: twin-arginine translocation signal domain-containing protein [Puia sp.]|jgi:intracellular sulfur oxidation DsrE/DsrF family protein|nr:twin-arginine translocation signal domain-containing protein [Puia sp.]
MSQQKFIKSANRRDFLGKVTGAAALMGVASLINPAKASDSIHSFTGNAPDPDEWFKGIRGKHRIVFDCTEPKEIFPFAWPKIYMMTNEATGASDKDCTAVVVFRHGAFLFALQDSLWAKYKLGEMQKVMDPQTKAFAVRNPFWKPKPDDFSVPGLGNVTLGIPELQTMGIMFCVCNMALTVYSAAVAMNTKQDAATVLKEWQDGLIPGIPAMPSGVYAVGRAQEHGCGYCNV